MKKLIIVAALLLSQSAIGQDANVPVKKHSIVLDDQNWIYAISIIRQSEAPAKIAIPLADELNNQLYALQQADRVEKAKADSLAKLPAKK